MIKIRNLPEFRHRHDKSTKKRAFGIPRLYVRRPILEAVGLIRPGCSAMPKNKYISEKPDSLSQTYAPAWSDPAKQV
jgi:hypothetical protein